MGGFKIVVVMVKVFMEEYKVIVFVVIYLDYGLSFEFCVKVIYVGFIFVMIDVFYYLFEENVVIIFKVVEFVYFYGVFVEVEFGIVGG